MSIAKIKMGIMEEWNVGRTEDSEMGNRQIIQAKFKAEVQKPLATYALRLSIFIFRR
jgi:hypothetical protein